MNLRMSNKLDLNKNKKPGKRFPGFCLLILAFILGSALTEVSSEIRLPAVLFQKNSTEFYDGDSIHLRYDGTSMEAVNNMYKILLDNANIIIEISAHTSHEENNPIQLSEQRGNKVKELLVKKGVDPVRMQVKGWGFKKLKITDNQILNAKTKMEKEALRQANRRVIFKVLSWDYPVPESPKVDTLKTK